MIRDMQLVIYTSPIAIHKDVLLFGAVLASRGRAIRQLAIRSAAR